MAQSQVSHILGRAQTVDSRTIIARYTAAFAINFTDWLGKTLLSVRHPTARHALEDNLRCETKEDHTTMLQRFAKLCDALPSREHFAHTEKEVRYIRELLADFDTAGLVGISLFAVLESTSIVFMPDLAHRAKGCGCTNFTYPDTHGEADTAHSDAFIEALVAEKKSDYDDSDRFIHQGVYAGLGLIDKIYAKA